MPKKRWSSLTPVLLIGVLIAAVHFSLPPAKEVDLKSILGMWEGEFTRKGSSNIFPIRVIFNKDGSYQYDSAYKTTKGIVELKKGKIHLLWDGWEGMTFSLRQEKNGQMLLNDNPGFGKYRLGRVK